MVKNISFEKVFYYTFAVYLLLGYLQARGWLQSNFLYAIIHIMIFIWGIQSFIMPQRRNNRIKNLMLVFIIYVVLSGFLYLMIDRPFSCYMDSVRNFILPMLLFYSGMVCRDKNRFYYVIGGSFVLILFLTLIPYITFAPWYIDYISSLRIRTLEVYDAGMIANMRFSATMASSYFVMYLTYPILCFLLNKVVIEKQNSVFLYIMIIVCLISLFLCQQRTAILFAFISVPFFLYFSKRKVGSILIFTILIAAILYFWGRSGLERTGDLSDLLGNRIQAMSFSEAFGEREAGVTKVFSVWKNPILGDGVGVYSHAAHYQGYISVNDCAWIKILVENGVVGLLIFLVIYILTLVRAIKYRKFFYQEILIMIFFGVAMIGSDSLSMVVLYPLLFWFTLGLVWNPRSITSNISQIEVNKKD